MALSLKCYNNLDMELKINSLLEMHKVSSYIGQRIVGGEVIELIGDVGAGKTAFTKGLAEELGITDPIQSPTFTISNCYYTPGNLELAHYDFYRLNDAGLMREELREAIDDPLAIVVLEWGAIVADVLPTDRLTIYIQTISEVARVLTIKANGAKSARLIEGLQ